MSSDDGTEGLEEGLNAAAAAGTEPAAKSPPKLPPAPVPTPQSKARKGNEVFKQTQAPQPGGMESVSRDAAAKQEFGFEIPVDAVPLPSKGLVYPPEHPLHGAQQVEYRAMTAKEEDILMSEALIKRGTVITELIKNCLIDKSINVNSLLSGDRNALMVAIRISGYGRAYKPTFVCPECGGKNEMDVDLADLSVKPMTVEPVSPGLNAFAFDLPVSKQRVEFKFLTGNEEEVVMKNMESKKKRGMANTNLVTTRLLSSIVSVNGSDNQGLIARFVGFMPARDSLELRKYIDKHEPGVDMEVEFTCTGCDYIDDIQLPMGPSFFWPST